MSQHDMNVGNASGANVRTDLNNCIQALVTNSSGNSEPTTTFAFMFWVDTLSSPNLLKIRNAADSAWITVGRVDLESLGLKFLEASNSEPTDPQAFQYWVDTNGARPILKIRNLANDGWITIGYLDVDNYGLMPITGGTFSGYISFSNTDYIKLPVGTTAQRPGTPVAGMIRYNSDQTSFEGHNGTAWAPVGGGGYDVSATQSITAGGEISSSTTNVRQQRPIQGNAAAVDASITPFGTTGGWKDGTEILLIGISDENSVLLTFNDAAKGIVGNFSTLELTKYRTASFTYNLTLDRWIYQGGN